MFYSSMDGPGEDYAKLNKPYDFTYMWNLMDKINKVERDSQIQRTD